MKKTLLVFFSFALLLLLVVSTVALVLWYKSRQLKVDEASDIEAAARVEEIKSIRSRRAMADFFDKMASSGGLDSNIESAIESSRAALNLRKEIYEEEPGSVEYKVDLMRAYLRHAAFLKISKDMENSRKNYELAVALVAGQSTNEDPIVARYLAEAYSELAKQSILSGDKAAEDEYYRLAISTLKAFVENHRSGKSSSNVSGEENRRVEEALANTQIEYANKMHKEARYDSAEQLYSDALRILNGLIKTDPSNTQWGKLSVMCNHGLGDVNMMRNSFAKARYFYGQAQSVAEAMVQKKPDDFDSQHALSISIMKMSAVVGLEDLEASLELKVKARKIHQRLAEKYPENAMIRRELSMIEEFIKENSD